MGKAVQGRDGRVGLGPVLRRAARSGQAMQGRNGSAWLDWSRRARHDSVRYGSVQFSGARPGKAGIAELVRDGRGSWLQRKAGSARPGAARRVVVWQGRQGPARSVLARLYSARLGKAGRAGLGAARRRS